MSLLDPFIAATTLSELESALVDLGAKPLHCRYLWRCWLGRKGWGEPLPKGQRLPKAIEANLERIRAKLESFATIRSRHPGAEEQSERLLVTLADKKTVEAVLLPRRGVCVSSQLGCAVGCKFCMTGQGGLIRQLTDAEIVGQVALARGLRPNTKKVVFMGMGEPSHNLKAVLSTVSFLAEYGDFGHKDLVISSVGDKRFFEALKAMPIRPALAVSLHTVMEEKRRDLLPKAGRLTVDELLAYAGEWGTLSGYPVQYEWTLIAGLNDSEEEMRILAQKLQGQYAMVNFIPVNAVEGSTYQRPEREHCRRLVTILREAGIVATLRDSAAQDVDGGCGQLRARHVKDE